MTSTELTTKPQKARKAFRPLIHLGLLGIAWWFLSRWYFSGATYNYLLFLCFFLPAIASILLPYLRMVLPRIPRQRLLPAGLILLLVLPLSEWFKLNPNTVGREWTRQIYLNSLILYILYLLFKLLPGARRALWSGFRAVVAFFCSRTYLFWLPAVLYFGVSSWIAVFAYQKIPMIEDSSSYLFQAKLFSRFLFYAAVPPHKEFFSCFRDLLVMKDNRWFGMYPPGFSLLLGAAMLMRSEFLLSPLLGAATIAIWMEYARRWHGKEVAFFLGVLMLTSPFLLVMTSSVMVHTPELFLVSCVIFLCRLQMEEKPGFFSYAFLILAIALAVLVRFFSILVFLSPVLLYCLFRAPIDRKRAWMAAVMMGVATGFLLLALYQWRTSGSPFVSGYQLEYEGMPGHRFGFVRAGAGERHTPLRGLENTSDNLLALNLWLSGLCTGSLFFFAAFFLLNLRLDTWDWLLLLSCFAIAFFYFLYFFQDLSYGPRYFFLMVPAFFLLLSRLVVLGSRSQRESHSVIAAMLVLALLLSVPIKLPALIRQCSPLDRMAGNLAHEIEKLGSQKTIVFLDREITQTLVDWNDPQLASPTIICLDLGDRNVEIEAQFPGYRAGYFRPVSSMEAANDRAQYRIYPTPASRESGHLSAYQLALTFLATADYPNKDIFDIAYADLLRRPSYAPSRLQYLTELRKQPPRADYRSQFRSGVLGLGRLILLPQAAFFTHRDQWQQAFDCEDFRQEMAAARLNLTNSGEIGKPLLACLDTVQQRMDQNGDHVYSDAEILQFVGSKRKL